MNWQVAIEGSPEQLKEIAVLRIGTDTTLIENTADWPAEIVALVAGDDMANGVGFVPTIWVKTGEVLIWKLLSPL